MIFKIIVDGKELHVKAGENFVSGGKVYVVCGDCHRVIRVDGLFGSVHLCIA